MVSRVTQNICQKPTPSPGKSGPFCGPSRETIRELPPSDLTKLHKTSGLDHLRESLPAEGISKRATTLITNSRRTS